MKKEVRDELVDSVILLRPYPWFRRNDVLPFTICYTVFFVMLTQPHLKVVGFVCIPFVLSAQIILFMISQFSVSVKCRLGSKIVSSVTDAKKVLVIAAKTAGKDRIVDLNRTKELQSLIIAGSKFSTSPFNFEFQKVVYNYISESDNFTRLKYPSVGAADKFYNSTGHKSSQDVTAAANQWGRNDFDIPLPDFLDLYVEHLVAPFFVFQMLCLVLWSLDDYWYYSALTGMMLLFFEGVLAKQRLVSLENLRAMKRQPVPMYVFRCGRWEVSSSENIVPGDIISLSFTPTSDTTMGRRSQQITVEQEKIIPCDALIIRGSCVVNEAMLTGESVPQVKESLRMSSRDDEETLEANIGDIGSSLVSLGDDGQPHPVWKRHMVFGGTAITQHTETLADEEKNSVVSDAARASGGPFPVPRAPDSGCQAIVVRTGYGTSQGGLMRKILFATERVNVNSRETFMFIGVLLVFAVISSAVVLREGLFDKSRNQFKLVLHCIMIVTSVVPPELPMELSLAVTNSLQALVQGLVYCTEPFRIPFAGRVSMLCFDKTGTLTQDRMNLRGVVNSQNHITVGGVSTSLALDEVEDVPSANSTVEDPANCGDMVLCAMACCQSLINPRSGKGVLGDPLEVESFSKTGFQVSSAVSSSSVTVNTMVHQERGLFVKVLHRFQFSSALKRMSVVAEIAHKSKNASVMSTHRMVFSKGAPEVLQKYLNKVPANYQTTYTLHMSMGRRVIALAYRILEDEAVVASLPRARAEADLTFIGFLVFDSALKSDSKSVMNELKWMHTPTVMITGDSPYTAADVARKLSMVSKSKGLLILDDVDGVVKWKFVINTKKNKAVVEDPSKFENIPFDPQCIAELSCDHSLCVTGQALQTLDDTSHVAAHGLSISEILKKLCPHVRIYARVSPSQKENIILSMNSIGMYTLMCGDGTNDVGALKAAHVGISIINDPELERKMDSNHLRQQDSEVVDKKKMKQKAAQDRLARAMAELQEIKSDPTAIKLGDASIASPFTARRTSIDSVLTVLRQGRCSLVTMIQVYKILALNCLVSAYMMSSLYLQGLKQGDTQMTATGLCTAGLFFFISRAKSLPRLSPEKPPDSVFAKSVIMSIAGQFIVHLACLVAVLHLCGQHSDPRDQSSRPIPDSRFQPNLVNSSVYLLASMIQVNNFVVNYRGHPFTESIWDNAALSKSLLAIYCVIFVLVSGVFEPLSDFLQLVAFPSVEFQYYLGLVLAFNLCAAYGIEKLSQQLE